MATPPRRRPGLARIGAPRAVAAVAVAARAVAAAAAAAVAFAVAAAVAAAFAVAAALPPPPSQSIRPSSRRQATSATTTPRRRRRLRRRSPRRPACPSRQVDVTVVAASVKIFVEIAMPDDATAVAAVLSTLQTKLTDADAATAFLADADVTVVNIDSVPRFFAPPPPPPSPWWGATGCPITRSYCMTVGLRQLQLWRLRLPRVEIAIATTMVRLPHGGHGSPATSSWPNQHECREYSVATRTRRWAAPNEAMGDPAACAYGYRPTHQPQSYDGCEDGGNYGCNPGDCWVWKPSTPPRNPTRNRRMPSSASSSPRRSTAACASPSAATSCRRRSAPVPRPRPRLAPAHLRRADAQGDHLAVLRVRGLPEPRRGLRRRLPAE